MSGECFKLLYTPLPIWHITPPPYTLCHYDGGPPSRIPPIMTFWQGEKGGQSQIWNIRKKISGKIFGEFGNYFLL
jgi:hypothetical protein